VARSESGVHPVVGLWPVEMTQDLRKALNEGVRKVGAWAELQSAIEVAFPQGQVAASRLIPSSTSTGQRSSPRLKRC
jgi:molybdopterin-guanine dinucleotide biosynthesis protein A